MKDAITKGLAGSLNALTVSTGAGTSAWGALEYWSFINTNAAGLGIILTLIFGITAFAFNLYNSAKMHKVDKNAKELDSHSQKLELHIKETSDQLSYVHKSLGKILQKLGV